MTYDEVRMMIDPLPIGTRVRVTHPNGFQRVGEIGRWREYPTLGGKLVGGEYDGATKIETMLANGRYSQLYYYVQASAATL